MPSTFSPALRLELIGNGEQAANWGNTTNTNLGTLLEQAIAGVQSIAMGDANYTLVGGNGVADEARNAVIIMTGTLTATRNVVVPTSEKFYAVRNATTGGQSILVKTSAGTGVTLVNGFTQLMYCDGTNVVAATVSYNTTTGSIGDIVAGNLTATGATISGSSSTNLVRITQTGTGNALLVEDSANPDATPFVVTADGIVVVGHTTATVTSYDVQSITTDGASYVAQRWSADSGAPFVRMDKSRSATIGTNSIVSSGDTLGVAEFRGDDGAAFQVAAQIYAQVDDTPGAGDMPGRLVFATTSNGSATTTERMVIKNNGFVGIGTTSPTCVLSVASTTATTNAVTRVLRVDSQSSGTPATGIGVGIEFASETASGNTEIGAAIDAISTDVTAASEDFALSFKTMTAGAAATEKMRIDSVGFVGIGTTSPDRLLSVVSTTATTNNVTRVLRIDSQSSGTPAAGIGVGMEFVTETAVGNTEIGAAIDAITTDVTAASEDFDLSFKTMAAGAAAAERVRITSTGDFKFNSGYGSVATAYGCRAWVNFNGTGTVAIKASGNVTSITDNGTGDYTVLFTTAMPDSNYAVAGMTLSEPNGNTTGNMVTIRANGSYIADKKDTAGVRVLVGSTDSIVPTNLNDVSVIVMR